MRMLKTLTTAVVMSAMVVWNVAAQDYPSKPITMIIPFAPGGSTDIAARVIAQGMGEQLGQTVVVENRPGASGIVAANAVKAAKPDGYTLLFGSNSTLASNVTLHKDLSYDPITDFVAISQPTGIPCVLVVHPSVPADTVEEFIAYVKENPGKVNYGSAGLATTQHIGGALFENMIGGSMVHVPFTGGAPAITDLLAGRVQAVFGPIVELLPHIKANSVKVLGLTTPQPSAILPDTKPIADILPGFNVPVWHAVVAPAGTPKEIIDTVWDAIEKTLANEAISAKLVNQGLDIIATSPEEFAAALPNEIESSRKLLELAGAVSK